MLCDARALVEKSRGESSHQEPSSAVAAPAPAPAPAGAGAGAQPEGGGGDRDREPAVPRLTTGGIITLERTLTKLEALQQAPTP